MSRRTSPPVNRRPGLHDTPTQLLGATRWTDERLYGLDAVLTMARSIPNVRAELEAIGELEPLSGPRRMPGNWAYAYIAFTLSSLATMEPWWNAHERDLAYWQKFGFTQVPSYRTVWARFAELENYGAGVLDAVAAVVRPEVAKRQEIGAWLHIDATETQTHANPRDVCLVCPGGKRGDVRISPEEAGQLRSAENEKLVEGDPAPTFQGLTRLDVTVATDLPLNVNPAKVGDRAGRLFLSGGHWRFSADPHAGTRAYAKKGKLRKAWHGFLTQTVVDHHTGLPVAIRVFPADQQEADQYPRALAAAEAAMGAKPVSVAGDAGYSFGGVFQINTLSGIASVFPYRSGGKNATPTAPATTTFDEHGIPLCRGCGHPTNLVRFALETRNQKRRARLLVACELPVTAACDKQQYIDCATDFRRLLPVWRTHRAYQAMREGHQSYEWKHGALRQHYRVAANGAALRPRRISMAGLQLRANFAVLIEWLRFKLVPAFKPVTRVNSATKMRGNLARSRQRNGRGGGGLVLSTRGGARHGP